MDTQDIVEKWRNEARQEGAEAELVGMMVEFYEDRFGDMPAEVRAAVEATHDKRTLRTWIKLATSGTAEDVVTAIRASRTS